MWIERTVVMLPTDQKAPYGVGKQFIVKPAYKEGLITGIVDRITRFGHSWSNTGVIFGLGKPQHLYILSDDEIKEGDLIFNTLNNCIARVYFNESKNDAFKKVIATTDPSINLPSPSQSFIQKFVEEYNKGNIITEVMVEYEDKGYLVDMEGIGGSETDWFSIITPKVDPKDNTINIQLIKNCYTREEVYQLFVKFWIDVVRNHRGQITNVSTDWWLRENLPNT